MMYRSGWASKKDQTKVLTIHITRTGFEEILSNAAISGPGTVRLQWDPDHTPNGNKIPDRRAIQLGIKGEMLEKFSKEFIIKIDDITDFVLEQSRNFSNDETYRCFRWIPACSYDMIWRVIFS